MDQYELYRYLGLLGSIMAWSAIAVVLYKWPVEKTKSVSKHVAAYKKAWKIFVPIEVTALALLYIFAQKWFIPTMGLGIYYNLILTLALFLELITTIVPDTEGLKHQIHHYTSYSAVLLLPILNVLIAIAPGSNNAIVISAIVSLVGSLTIIGLYLFTENTRENHLIYQSVYFAFFHIPLLTAIFTA